MQSVKVSAKHQIVVPSAARRQLGIAGGDRLTVEVRGDELILRRRPARASDRLRGLGRHVWEGLDATSYVRGLREETERRSARPVTRGHKA
jgi:AbrB family looped-hinge helix DNA binding protein